MIQSKSGKFLALVICGGALMLSACGKNYNGTYEGTTVLGGGTNQSYGSNSGGSAQAKVELKQNGNMVSGPVSINNGQITGYMNAEVDGKGLTKVNMTLYTGTSANQTNQNSSTVIYSGGICGTGPFGGEILGDEKSLSGNLGASNSQQGCQGTQRYFQLTRSGDSKG